MSDQLDRWCQAWAYQRRKAFGVAKTSQMFEPRERLGKLNCTLGRLKEEAEAAGERSVKTGLNGHPDQNWPEVYVGVSLEIHRCFMRMPGEWRMVMDAHYVWFDVPIVDRVRYIGITPRRYADILELLKTYLAGYLRADANVAKVPRGRPKRIENVKQTA